jgi:hypothetical protein
MCTLKSGRRYHQVISEFEFEPQRADLRRRHLDRSASMFVAIAWYGQCESTRNWFF